METKKVAIQSELLLIRHRSGDPEALGELVALWERPLLYYLRRLVDREEDAWDALQEVWCRVVRGIGRLREPRALPAWLYTVARSVAFTQRRRDPHHESLPEGEEGAELAGEAPEPSLAGYEAGDIHRALARLSLPHREALTLHFLEGFSLAEIGGITGSPVGTIKSRLHHAKRALRRELEGGTV